MKRTAFTLTELLVVIAIVILLMSLVLAGVSAARSSQRKNQTRVTISKINDILMNQWRTYPSQYISLPSATPYSGWKKEEFCRWNRITGDLPANWKDVVVIYNNSLFKTRAQNTYRTFWQQRVDHNSLPTDQYADGECLFLSVMHGGFAGCLDCAGLRSGKDFKDTDSDSSPEFIDAWGNPLGFVLWPAGLATPDGNLFFSNGDSSSDKLTYELRPLVFSAGPNGEYGIDVGGGKQSDLAQTFSNLALGNQCGLPSGNSALGSVVDAAAAADNLTNFDAEFRR
jgi:type II secretory pathway pseudopilin PulG